MACAADCWHTDFIEFSCFHTWHQNSKIKIFLFKFYSPLFLAFGDSKRKIRKQFLFFFVCSPRDFSCSCFSLTPRCIPTKSPRNKISNSFSASSIAFLCLSLSLLNSLCLSYFFIVFHGVFSRHSWHSQSQGIRSFIPSLSFLKLLNLGFWPICSYWQGFISWVVVSIIISYTSWCGFELGL